MLFTLSCFALVATSMARENACKDGASQRDVIPGKIYACPGTIAKGGSLGQDAEKLCTGEYEVCPSAKRTSELGLTPEKCRKVAKDSREFFATKETSAGWLACYSDHPTWKQTKENDIFGCARSDAIRAPGRLYQAHSNGALCHNSLTTAIGNGDWGDWKYQQTSTDRGEHEAKVYKLTSKKSGGVLCCKKPKKSGCKDKKDEREVVKDKVYACPGTINSGGLYGKDAELLCDKDFEVCPSAKRTSELGLTPAKCRAAAKTNEEFFGTKETSPGWLKCYSDHARNGNHANNDVFGCARQKAKQINGRIYQAHGNGALCKNSLTTAIGNGDWLGWKYSQSATDRGYQEAKKFRLTNKKYGGVLCCAKNDKRSEVEPLVFYPEEDDDDLEWYLPQKVPNQGATVEIGFLTIVGAAVLLAGCVGLYYVGAKLTAQDNAYQFMGKRLEWSDEDCEEVILEARDEQ